MPRVVHVTTVHAAFDPRIFHKQLQTLRAAGFDVHLVAQHGADETVQGVAITALPPVTGRAGRLRLHPLAFARARALAADVYHVHDPELIPVAYALKRATGAAVVYDMHEDYRAGRGPEGMALRALERWCFRWVDHVVLANPTARPIVATADVPVTLIKNYPRWMPGTAPSSPFPDTPDRHAPRRLVCTGVQSVERGLLTLVDLAALLAESADDAEWRLDCVGVCYRPDDRRRVEAHVRHRPAATRVLRRIGWDAYVPHATIAEATARAHVGLALFRPHPAHARVLLTKFYEYLRHGLPILCSDFPLWRRFVQAHGCGAVVPPGDAEAAARVLRRWRADPARYRALCEGARRAAPRFRWSVMGARLVRLYRHLMA